MNGQKDILDNNQENILRNIVYYTLKKRKYQKSYKVAVVHVLAKHVSVSPTTINKWLQGSNFLNVGVIFDMLKALELSIPRVMFILSDHTALVGGKDRKDWLSSEKRRLLKELRDLECLNPFEKEEGI